MKLVSKIFNSLSELASYVKSVPAAGCFVDVESEKLASVSGSKDFTGSESYETADDLLLTGWSEGAERVSAVMAKSGYNASVPKERLYLSPVGYVPMVGPYLAGSPNNMINKTTVRRPARVVSLAYNCSVSANVNASDVEAAAAKLFNVVAGLERSGVRVDLWAVEVSAAGGETAVIATKIKSAGQPFNLLKMIYPVVHPSFLRRHMFAVIERVGVCEAFKYGYGRPVSGDESAAALRAAGVKTNNVLSFYDIQRKSESEILELIK